MNRRDIFKLFGGAAAIPAVKSVERLELGPSDALVVACDRPITREMADRIYSVLAAKFPGRTILVHGSDMELKVLKG